MIISLCMVSTHGLRAEARQSSSASPLTEAVRTAVEAEVAHHLLAGRPLDDSRRALHDSAVQYRVLIVELLDAARAADDTGHAAMLMGMRMFDGRNELDAMLAQIDSVLEATEQSTAMAADDQPGSNGESAELARARRVVNDLIRFNRAVLDRRSPIQPGERAELQEQLIPVLAPLVDGVLTWTKQPLASRWLTQEEAGRISRALPHHLPRGAKDALQRELRSLLAFMRKGTAFLASDDVIGSIFDALDRGTQFAEYHTHVHGALQSLHRMAQAGEVVQAATWLEEAAREEYASELQSIIHLYESPDTRASSRDRLDQLERRVSMITILNQLAAFDVADESLRALQRAESDDITQTMLAARTIALKEAPVALQSIARELDRRYESAEEALLTSLRNGEHDAILIEQHTAAHRMRRGMALVPKLIETAEKIAPRQSSTAERRVIQRARLLLDPARRDDAAAWLQLLAEQCRRYAPMPFERELREPARAAVELTGGRQGEFVSLLDRQREAWMRQWARPDAAIEELARLDQMRTLGETMRDAAILVEAHPDELASRLNEWPLWLMPELIIQRHTGEIVARLRIAVHALLEGDTRVLEAELKALEYEGMPGLVVGRLARLIPDAANDSSPLIAALSDLTILPPNDAWMVDRSESLAALCRAALEWQYARESGDTETAERFQARTITASRKTLEALAGPDT